MQAVYPDIGSGWKLPGKEAITVDDVPQFFGREFRILIRAAGFALPVGPGEIPGINEVIHRIPFPHQGAAEVGFIASEEILELRGIIVASDHPGGGPVE